MAYNREIVTDLLRGRLGYGGVVNSDTGITTGMPWGVEALSLKERYRKAIEAGVDRLGGDSTPEIIVELVREGSLAEARVDESARRILRVFFALGLFENPYVSPEAAARTVRKAEFQQKADLAQRKSIVLLKNADGLLPLGKGARMYVEGVDPAVAARYGYVSTGSLEDADVAILRVSAGRGGLGPGLRARGPVPIDLTLPAETLARVRAVMRRKPTVVGLHLNNPLVVPELASEAGALLATFGVSDEALFDVLTGKHPPMGRLPFEMPSSMEAVRAQREDVPHDSKDPLFPIGTGLVYPDPR
jgi:beta-glucosidase